MTEMTIHDLTKAEIFDALYESIKLQSHYAKLLNQYDNGHRLSFVNAYSWIQRLRDLRGLRDKL